MNVSFVDFLNTPLKWTAAILHNALMHCKWAGTLEHYGAMIMNASFRDWIFDFSHDWEGHSEKITGGNLLTQKSWAGHPFNTEMKGAVISTDYKFYPSNHDWTHRSLWGCTFEQWLCATIGPLLFTIPLLLLWSSPEKCSPLFTKGNTQFSHNEIHSTQRGFSLLFPLPWRITAQRLSPCVVYET